MKRISVVSAKPWRVFATAFALAFLMMLAWSLATPLFAGPDETAHVDRTVSLWRGQVVGWTMHGRSDAWTAVNAPRLYSDGAMPFPCFAFKDTVPASCEHIGHSRAVVPVATYVGRYPPLYYAVVGWPSAATTSTAGLYLMRFVSDLVSALFVALAVAVVVVWSKSRLLLLGILVALTPTALYCASVVNPSGLEISAALCLWCSGLVLALERIDDPPRGLIVIMATSICVLVLTRPLSPLWAALILVVVALLAGPRPVLRLLGRRDVRWAALVALAATAFAIVWLFTQHALDVPPSGAQVTPGETGGQIFATAFGSWGFWFHQMVGTFGDDTASPLLTYVSWSVASGALLLLALACSRLRRAFVLGLLVVLVVFVPVLVEYARARSVGFIWDGRYTIPLAIGIPLVAAVLIDHSTAMTSMRSRLTAVLGVGITLGSFLAFAEALRRYTVGVTGPLDYFHGPWSPPWGALTLTLGYLAGSALFTAFLWYLATTEPPTAARKGARTQPTEPAFAL